MDRTRRVLSGEPAKEGSPISKELMKDIAAASQLGRYVFPI